MDIITIGAGFVGTTHSAVLASHGHNVLAYDINKKRIDDLSSRDPERIDGCIYEPGLANLVRTHRNLEFTSNFADVAKKADIADVAFMCLPTPAEELDLPDEQKFLFKAGKSVAEALKGRNNCGQSKYVLIVNKSTVPIGTAAKLERKLSDWGVKNYGVASNPEFLVEGKAVSGSQNPDRVVIGCKTKEDEMLLREVYRNLSSSKIIPMKPADAEATKLLANFELYGRIVQNYHIAGRLCEEVPGLNYENVIAGVTADERIPKWGHFVSLYAGGSCFDKDAQNLLHTLQACMGAEYATQFIRLVIEGNQAQLKRFYDRAAEQAKFDFSGKRIALLGTAFKQGTNDVRMSPALQLTEWLLRDGAKEIRAYDPQAAQNYKKTFDDSRVGIFSTVPEAFRQTDAAMICTDWPEFKFIAPEILNTKRPYLLMDGRRSLVRDYEELAANWVSIIAAGSPYMGKNV